MTGRCCGKEGHSPGARAGRQPVPGGKVQFFCQMSLTFILMSAGSSELGSDRIKVVFIEDQSGWAPGEDISEQSKWGTQRDTRTVGQRESVDVSRSLRAGNDVISPSTLQRGCSHQHASRGLVSPACKKRKGTWKGGGEFLRDTESKGTLSPFSSSFCGTEGLAQSNGVGGRKEDRIGAKDSVPGFSGSCSCFLRDRVSQLWFLKLEK